MKYIIFDDSLNEQPVVFSSLIQHFHMAYMIGEDRVVSAGSVRIENGKFVANGESISLGIKSRPEDTKLINRMFGCQNVPTEVS